MNRYSNYLNGDYFDGGGIATYINLIIQAICFLFVYVVCKKKKRSNGGNQDIIIENERGMLYYDRYLVGSMLVMVLLDIIGISNTIMGRVTAYFSPAMYLAIPYSLSLFTKNNRKSISILIVALLLLNYVVVMIYRPEWYGVSNYTFFWQGE